MAFPLYSHRALILFLLRVDNHNTPQHSYGLNMQTRVVVFSLCSHSIPIVCLEYSHDFPAALQEYSALLTLLSPP